MRVAEPQALTVAILLVWAAASVRDAVGVEAVLDETNSWAFVQPHDPFDNRALLDLRHLNEARSGQTGFVRLSAGGNDFVRGDGTPLRFWCVGSDGHSFPAAEMDRHARWLAKLGVNMVRLHVTVCRHDEGARITDLDERLIDGVFRFVRAAKENGLYVMISPFYAHFTVPASWGISGGAVRAEGLIFIDDKVQEAYRHWTRELYGRVNPHTGLALKDDPTVAILQIHNEDSLLFWTADKLGDHHRSLLAERFSAWLAGRYGTVEKAWHTWGEGWKGSTPFDDVPAGRLGCVTLYELTLPGEGAYRRRLDDTARFLGEFQREFYATMGRYLRDEVGCRQLLNASNWRTAGDARLKALERHSYHALDVDAENEYVGSDDQHVGPHADYRIDPGHFLVNASVLGRPVEMCTNWRQEEGHPFFATETAWKNPNRYQSEGPFLVAAYQSLTGVDGVAWFTCASPAYDADPLKTFWRVDDQLCVHKWNYCTPALMAGFPANALLYRRGYLREAKPVVCDVRGLEAVFSRQPPRIDDDEVNGPGTTPADLEGSPHAGHDAIPRAAYLVGPVRSILAGDPRATRVTADVTTCFDPAAGTIRSATGEILWNCRRELCTMTAPKAQGVTGFLARNGGRHDLGTVVIESGNEYATVNVVSLDDRPLTESASVLVQVVTLNRLTGFRTEPAHFTVGNGDRARDVAGERIVRIGVPPYRIANTDVQVTIRNPRLTTATILDVNGYAAGVVPVDDGLVRLPTHAIYAILTPEPPSGGIGAADGNGARP